MILSLAVIFSNIFFMVRWQKQGMFCHENEFSKTGEKVKSILLNK